MTSEPSKTLEPGIYPGMSFSDYCGIDAINISRLAYFIGRTDFGAKHKLDHADDETASLLTGHAGHTAILEADIFDTIYCTQPDFGDLRTKAAREARDDWQRDNAGKAFLTAEQAAEVQAMKAALAGCHDPEIRELMDGRGQNELTGVWRDEPTGLLCKLRVDRLTALHGYPTIIDLKTGNDISERGVQGSIGEYHYHVRLAWYMDGMDALKRIKDPQAAATDWMGVLIWLRRPGINAKTGTPKEAYEVRGTQCDDHAYTEGRATYRDLLTRYHHCVTTGQWSSFPHGLAVVNPPRWAYRFTVPEGE